MNIKKNWQYHYSRTIEFLDSIPIKDFIKYGHSLITIMDDIECAYGSSLENDETFKGMVFNWMNVEEFADYLMDKGYNVVEDVHIDYWV